MTTLPFKNPSKNLVFTENPLQAPSKNPSQKHLLLENLLRTLLRVASGCMTPLVCTLKDVGVWCREKNRFILGISFLLSKRSRERGIIDFRRLSERRIEGRVHASNAGSLDAKFCCLFGQVLWGLGSFSSDSNLSQRPKTARFSGWRFRPPTTLRLTIFHLILCVQQIRRATSIGPVPAKPSKRPPQRPLRTPPRGNFPRRAPQMVTLWTIRSVGGETPL